MLWFPALNLNIVTWKSNNLAESIIQCLKIHKNLEHSLIWNWRPSTIFSRPNFPICRSLWFPVMLSLLTLYLLPEDSLTSLILSKIYPVWGWIWNSSPSRKLILVYPLGNKYILYRILTLFSIQTWSYLLILTIFTHVLSFLLELTAEVTCTRY